MKLERPIISIIVPIYNARVHLAQCIESIEKQTITEKEIILVDDGSTDGSAAICDTFSKRYKDIRVIHKQNGGPSSARNEGIESAAGEYIGFVDSDDYIESDMYECLLNAMKKEKCAVGCCNWFRHIEIQGQTVIRPAGGSLIEDYTKLNTEQVLKKLLLNEGMTYSPCDKLFKSALFHGVKFPEENLPSEDIPCIYRILSRCGDVVHIGISKYYYRLTPDSRTQKKFSKANMSTHQYMLDIRKDIEKHFPELSQEADFALFQSAASIYNKIATDAFRWKFRKEQKELTGFFRKQIFTILRNPFLNNNAKIVDVLIGLRLYSYFLKLISKKQRDGA